MIPVLCACDVHVIHFVLFPLQEDLGLKDDTFELCYNKACLLLGQGNLTEALKLLERAEELCKESLEDDPVS